MTERQASPRAMASVSTRMWRRPRAPCAISTITTSTDDHCAWVSLLVNRKMTIKVCYATILIIFSYISACCVENCIYLAFSFFGNAALCELVKVHA